MADSEFEEFRYHFDTVPQHIKATAQTYTLVHDILLDDSPTSSKGSENTTDYDEGKETQSTTNDEDLNRDYDSAVFTIREDSVCSETTQDSISKDKEGGWPPAQPKRRRKLPEIPKNKKPFNIKSLADELSAFQPDESSSRYNPRNLLILKYLRDEETYFNDIDSGNSTAHSPEPAKSPPPYNRAGSDTPGSTECSSLLFSQLDLLEATHRGLHKFVPRHRDEMEVEIGDPIYVQKEADDLWCEGVNLRTGRQGIFPSAYAVDTEYDEFVSATPKVKRERFLLGYLGSVETTQHKGTKVLTAAVTKIVAAQHKPHQTILEISDQGLRLVDKSRPNKVRDGPCLDYFYSLKNVSFCAFHPRDHRYLGFITKHPTLQRFACHVFQGSESTRPVAEAIGRAFERFYQKFIETAYPTEDIYIE